MSQRQAPYLQVVRSASSEPPALSSDAPTSSSVSAPSESAQDAETDGIPFATLVATATRTRPRSAAQSVDSAVIVDSAPASDDVETPAAHSSGPLAQAVMYAVVSWLALCVERVAVAVDIQPVAERLYEVSAHFDEEHTQGILLRVRLDVEPGLVVRTTVEPIKP